MERRQQSSRVESNEEILHPTTGRLHKVSSVQLEFV